MTIIEATTLINAPIEDCFRLALSIDLELRAAADYGLRAVDGVISGTIGPGERVTWRTNQFGIWISHTSEITAFREPTFFQDCMVHGVFRTYSHDHFFEDLGTDKTAMRDVLSFSFPRLLMGEVAERLFVKRRLTTLLLRRNSLIKHHAESRAALLP
jgi:hypothetical protein